MDMDDARAELEDGIAKRRDVRMSTPQRQPPVKRRADEGDVPLDDKSLKARRLTDDSDMGMSSTQKEKTVSEEERKILAVCCWPSTSPKCGPPRGQHELL